ncbi:hypothetical protein [Sulfurimonas sp.]
MRKKLTAEDLLKLFLDLLSFSPDIKEWSLEEFQYNEPRLIRYQRLIALLQAFKLPTDIHNFVDGSFIDGTTDIYTEIREYMMRNNDTENRVGDIIGYDIGEAFAGMLEYRMKLNNVLSHNQQYFLVSHSHRYAYIQTSGINKKIKEELIEYDTFLAWLISPEKKTFTIKELEKSFNYPNVDLDQIDMDNW